MGTTFYLVPSNTVDYNSSSIVSVSVDSLLNASLSEACSSFEVSREDMVKVFIPDCSQDSSNTDISCTMGASLLIPLFTTRKCLPPSLPHDAMKDSFYSSSSTPSPYNEDDFMTASIPTSFSSLSSKASLYVQCIVEDISTTEGYSRSTTQINKPDGRYDFHIQSTRGKTGLKTLSLAPSPSSSHAKLLMHVDHSLCVTIKSICPVIDTSNADYRVRGIAEIVLNMPLLGLGINDDVVKGGSKKVVDWRNALCEVIRDTKSSNRYSCIWNELIIDIMQKLVDTVKYQGGRDRMLHEYDKHKHEHMHPIDNCDDDIYSAITDEQGRYWTDDLVDESSIFGFPNRMAINDKIEPDSKCECDNPCVTLQSHIYHYYRVSLILYDLVSFAVLCHDCKDVFLSPLCHVLRVFVKEKTQCYFKAALKRLCSEAATATSPTNVQNMLEILNLADSYVKSLNAVIYKISILRFEEDESTKEIREHIKAMCLMYKQSIQEIGEMLAKTHFILHVCPIIQDDFILEDWSAHNDFRRGAKVSYACSYLMICVNKLVNKAEEAVTATTSKNYAGVGISAFVRSIICTAANLCMETYQSFFEDSITVTRKRQRQLVLDIMYMFTALYHLITQIHQRNIIDLTGTFVDNGDFMFCDLERARSLLNFHAINRPEPPEFDVQSKSSSCIVLSRSISNRMVFLLIFTSLLSYNRDEKENSAQDDLWKAIKDAPRVKRDNIDIAKEFSECEDILIGNPLLSLESIDDYIQIFHTNLAPTTPSLSYTPKKNIIREFIAFGGLPSDANGINTYRNLLPSVDELRRINVNLVPLLCQLNVYISSAWILNAIKLRYEMIGELEGVENYPPLTEHELETRNKIFDLTSDLLTESKHEVYLKFTTVDIMKDKRIKHGMACVCRECIAKSMASAGHA